MIGPCTRATCFVRLVRLTTTTLPCGCFAVAPRATHVSFVKPALGWSSWNYYENKITEAVVKDVADGMVATGMVAAGYRYLNLDAGVWLRNRTAAGKLQEDPAKFPSGIPHLARYLKARNLSLGLYTDLSSATLGKVCGTGPGSYGHYSDDAATIASYGAEFVKVSVPPPLSLSSATIKQGHCYTAALPSSTPATWPTLDTFYSTPQKPKLSNHRAPIQ